jgi:hypothetical protein
MADKRGAPYFLSNSMRQVLLEPEGALSPLCRQPSYGLASWRAFGMLSVPCAGWGRESKAEMLEVQGASR